MSFWVDIYSLVWKMINLPFPRIVLIKIKKKINAHKSTFYPIVQLLFSMCLEFRQNIGKKVRKWLFLSYSREFIWDLMSKKVFTKLYCKISRNVLKILQNQKNYSETFSSIHTRLQQPHTILYRQAFSIPQLTIII